MTTMPAMLWLLLAASPSFPPPAEQPLEHCARAACTSAADVRVCKCLAPYEGAVDLLVVDRPEERRVLWPTTSRGEVTDFVVQAVDLDHDGAPELVVASVMSESAGLAVRSWDVSIVDGAADEAVHFVAHDFGLDALRGDTLLVTEWRVHPDQTLSFVGREYQYRGRALVPTKAPVLVRKFTPDLDKERARAIEAGPSPLVSSRAFFTHPSTTRGADDPPKQHHLANVRAVMREEPEYEVHAEDPAGKLFTFSSDGEGGPVFRAGDLKARRLFPLRYWPTDLEGALLGKKALMGLSPEGQPDGVVFLQ